MTVVGVDGTIPTAAPATPDEDGDGLSLDMNCPSQLPGPGQVRCLMYVNYRGSAHDLKITDTVTGDARFLSSSWKSHPDPTGKKITWFLRENVAAPDLSTGLAVVISVTFETAGNDIQVGITVEAETIQ